MAWFDGRDWLACSDEGMCRSGQGVLDPLAAKILYCIDEIYLA